MPCIPFSGHMFLDFLVIALIDQNIQNWIKWVVIRGNEECHGGHNKLLVLCFYLSPFWTTLQFTYNSSSPRLGQSSLVVEALADARHHHEERLHNNQLEWMRAMRGAQ